MERLELGNHKDNLLQARGTIINVFVVKHLTTPYFNSTKRLSLWAIYLWMFQPWTETRIN